MKKRLLSALLALTLLPLGAGMARADTRVGISIGNGGLEGFFLSIGDFYRAPRAEVVYLHEQRIPDEEIPVVFHVAREARVAPNAVMKLRLTGWNWVRIAQYYRLSPTVFYVAGYHPRPFRTWNEARFKDADVIRFVNARFISQRYHRPVAEVFRSRSTGARFQDIDRVYRGKQTVSRTPRNGSWKSGDPKARSSVKKTADSKFRNAPAQAGPKQDRYAQRDRNKKSDPKDRRSQERTRR